MDACFPSLRTSGGFRLRGSNPKGMRKTLSIVAAVIVLALPATAAAAVAVTGPGGFVAGFVPPVVVVAPGEELTYANADIAPHNFIAYEAYLSKKQAKKVPWCSGYDRGKCPVFWSETITLGESTEVLGLENVESGSTYPFYCSLHPGMKGTLVVR